MLVVLLKASWQKSPVYAARSAVLIPSALFLIRSWFSKTHVILCPIIKQFQKTLPMQNFINSRGIMCFCVVVCFIVVFFSTGNLNMAVKDSRSQKLGNCIWQSLLKIWARGSDAINLETSSVESEQMKKYIFRDWIRPSKEHMKLQDISFLQKHPVGLEEKKFNIPWDYWVRKKNGKGKDSEVGRKLPRKERISVCARLACGKLLRLGGRSHIIIRNLGFK